MGACRSVPGACLAVGYWTGSQAEQLAGDPAAAATALADAGAVGAEVYVLLESELSGALAATRSALG